MGLYPRNMVLERAMYNVGGIGVQFYKLGAVVDSVSRSIQILERRQVHEVLASGGRGWRGTLFAAVQERVT